MLDSDVKRCIQSAGFENYCFVSYPHANPEIEAFARALRESIHSELTNHVGNPGVYIDYRIRPGTEWPEDLRQNLCRSLAMVAVLVPVYFEPEHDWCGREWAAMAGLEKHRTPDGSIRPIIPVYYRHTELPPEAGARQALDFSQIAVGGGDITKQKRFKTRVVTIVEQIFEVAKVICQNKCRADVTDFQFPSESPFKRTPPQPLMKGR